MSHIPFTTFVYFLTHPPTLLTGFVYVFQIWKSSWVLVWRKNLAAHLWWGVLTAKFRIWSANQQTYYLLMASADAVQARIPLIIVNCQSSRNKHFNSKNFCFELLIVKWLSDGKTQSSGEEAHAALAETRQVFLWTSSNFESNNKYHETDSWGFTQTT